MNNKTFLYEFWHLLKDNRGYDHRNIIDIIFRILSLVSLIKTIYKYEIDFYNHIDEGSYDLAYLDIENMIKNGINKETPRIVSMRVTLDLEEMLFNN